LAPHEQLPANVALEPSHPFAHRGLAQVQPSRATAEAARLGNGSEDTEILQR
jgi:hypothetical protein